MKGLQLQLFYWFFELLYLQTSLFRLKGCLQALTLVGPTVTWPGLDPLAVLSPDNWLYKLSLTTLCVPSWKSALTQFKVLFCENKFTFWSTFKNLFVKKSSFLLIRLFRLLFVFYFKTHKTCLQPVSRPVELIQYFRGWGWVPGNTSGQDDSQKKPTGPFSLLYTQLFEHFLEALNGIKEAIWEYFLICHNFVCSSRLSNGFTKFVISLIFIRINKPGSGLNR